MYEIITGDSISEIKLGLIGERKVGKTSILYSFFGRKFKNNLLINFCLKLWKQNLIQLTIRIFN